MESSKTEQGHSRREVARADEALASAGSGSQESATPTGTGLCRPTLAGQLTREPHESGCALLTEFTIEDQTGHVVGLQQTALNGKHVNGSRASISQALDGEIARFDLGGRRCALIVTLSVRVRRALRDELAATTRTDFPSLLSDRERQIVEQICLGATTKQAAERLSIRELTVRSHLKAIFCKLGVRSRGAMVCRYALALARSQPSGHRAAL
jgi:DNA-binding NarL/FixJ family response regulator